MVHGGNEIMLRACDDYYELLGDVEWFSVWDKYIECSIASLD